MAKSKHAPGKFGNAPVNGRYFFVHRSSRCVRTWDMGSRPIPMGWEQVSLEEWVAFRKETLLIPLKKRKALHATLYAEKPLNERSTRSSRKHQRTAPRVLSDQNPDTCC